jgi:hypothetical protein
MIRRILVSSTEGFVNHWQNFDVPASYGQVYLLAIPCVGFEIQARETFVNQNFGIPLLSGCCSPRAPVISYRQAFLMIALQMGADLLRASESFNNTLLTTGYAPSYG